MADNKEHAEELKCDIKKLRKSARTMLIISIILAITAIAALISLSEIAKQRWISTVIIAVLIPLAMDIISFIKLPKTHEAAEQHNGKN